MIDVPFVASVVIKNIRDMPPEGVYAARRGVVAGFPVYGGTAYALRRVNGTVRLEVWTRRATVRGGSCVQHYDLPISIEAQAARLLDEL